MMMDNDWMLKAIELAKQAASEGEVPVGALVVCENELVSSAYNRREVDNQATAHAEVMAIHRACEKLGRWRLSDCTLYVTLEPCSMCAGAIINARVKKLVFGALDPKAGAVESLYNLLSDKRLNHNPEVVGGVLAVEASKLLTAFFQDLRKNKK